MTDILWLKFSEDTNLPPNLNEAEKEKLAGIFDAQDLNSFWNRAVRSVGLKEIEGPLLKWRGNTPYINWTAMTELITVGWIGIVQAEAYQYKIKGRFSNFLSFLKSQWKISQYFMRRINSDLPHTTEGKIVESLALGFALLMLKLRLPTHDEQKLADWLAHPENLKPPVRRTLSQIQDIQKRRTLLSPAWQEYFPSREEGVEQNYPDYFWNDEIADIEKESIAVTDHWKALPVSGGLVVGKAVLVRNGIIPEDTDPQILIFKQARPETIEFFSRGAAIIYAQGGAMSHACTIAREQNINCVTAAGLGFWDALTEKAPVWLSVDCATGEIKLIKQDAPDFPA